MLHCVFFCLVGVFLLVFLGGLVVWFFGVFLVFHLFLIFNCFVVVVSIFVVFFPSSFEGLQKIMKVVSSLRGKLFSCRQVPYLALENTFSVVLSYLLSDCSVLEQNLSQLSLHEQCCSVVIFAML